MDTKFTLNETEVRENITKSTTLRKVLGERINRTTPTVSSKLSLAFPAAIGTHLDFMVILNTVYVVNAVSREVHQGARLPTGESAGQDLEGADSPGGTDGPKKEKSTTRGPRSRKKGHFRLQMRVTHSHSFLLSDDGQYTKHPTSPISDSIPICSARIAMDSGIEEWQHSVLSDVSTELSSSQHDGIASRLATAAIKFFGLLLEHAPQHLLRSLEREYDYLQLWCDGYGVPFGELDAVLAESRRLRHATYRLLVSICRTLADRKFKPGLSLELSVNRCPF